MKDTYSMVTVAQKKQDDHNRMVMATHLMAAMVTSAEIAHKHTDELIAKRAVELADELIKAAKQ